MSRWYALDPIDESFFDNAPHVYRYPVDLPVPPERVWESLTSPNSVADWGPLLKEIRWTSERPFGVGTTRTAVLPLGAVTLHEEYFRWEDGHRKSFFVREANRPLLRSLGEDYLVEARPGGSRFTWTFALAGTPRTSLMLKGMGPGNALAFRQMAYGAKSYFAKHP